MVACLRCHLDGCTFLQGGPTAFGGGAQPHSTIGAIQMRSDGAGGRRRWELLSRYAGSPWLQRARMLGIVAHVVLVSLREGSSVATVGGASSR